MGTSNTYQNNFNMNTIISKLKALYIYSPERNINKALKKLKIISTKKSELISESRNEAISEILNCNSLPELLAYRIKQLDGVSYTLLGDKRIIDLWDLNAKCPNHSIKVLDWSWDNEINYKQLQS